METATGPVERQAEQTGPVERGRLCPMARKAEQNWSNGEAGWVQSRGRLSPMTSPMERQAESND